MYPVDELTQAKRPYTLAGKTYMVRQLKIREWGELNGWLKSQKPSPITLAIQALAEAQESAPVPQPVQDALFRQAQQEARNWPPKTGSLAWLSAIDSMDGGVAKFVQTAIKVAGTEIDETEADLIASRTKFSDLNQFVRFCLEGDMLVPKDEGEQAPQTPETKETTGAGSLSTSEPSSV